MEFDEYIKMINGRVSIFIFWSFLFAFFWSRSASAFVVSVTPSPASLSTPDDVRSRVREQLRDAVGRLQSVVSRMRGVIQDTRSYTQAMARERGADVGAVDRALTRVEDQLSRADAQVVALSQSTLKLDTGTSAQSILISARAQFRRIQTTLLSARDLLRDALDNLRRLDQQPTPSPTTASYTVTVTPAP